MTLNWYAVRILNNQENKVKTYLDREFIRNITGEYLNEVLIPVERYYEKTKDGKKKLIEKKLFSGYVLIKADLSREIVLDTIKKTPGIIGFLSYKDNNKSSIPTPLKEREVAQFLGRGSDLTEEQSTDSDLYIIGESVRITDGPFKTFFGEVKEIYEDKKKVVIDVTIFGRITPVEVDFKQTEKAEQNVKV
jgi:transcriptional antiterminator NusG